MTFKDGARIGETPQWRQVIFEKISFESAVRTLNTFSES